MKNPVTKAVFSAMECDLRVPSSNCSARPSLRGFTFTAVSVEVELSVDIRKGGIILLVWIFEDVKHDASDTSRDRATAFVMIFIVV